MFVSLATLRQGLLSPDAWWTQRGTYKWSFPAVTDEQSASASALPRSVGWPTGLSPWHSWRCWCYNSIGLFKRRVCSFSVPFALIAFRGQGDLEVLRRPVTKGLETSLSLRKSTCCRRASESFLPL